MSNEISPWAPGRGNAGSPAFRSEARGMLVRLCLWLVVGASVGCATARPTATPATGLLIENAVVVDGTGAGRRNADVRIHADRIAEVGSLDPRPGEAVVDAGGLVLAPGFIDTHSHHGSKLDQHRDALAVLSQGITTIVSGQDGGSTIPLADAFKALDARPAAINVAFYSGHNALREAVLGEDFKREATAAEIARMRGLLRADMQAGALGLSTGLEYDPGIYSSRAEVLELAREAATHGGRYISHMRSEDRDLWPALDELVEIGRQTGMPVQVSHAKLAMTDWWGQADRIVAVLERARAEGIDATLDVYPYTYWQANLGVLWPKRDFDNRATAEFVLEHLAPADGLLISGFDPDPSLVGKTVAQIAAQRGTDPATTAMDLLRETQGDAHVIGTSMDERDIATLVAWPHANICSDGGFDDLHPRGAGAFTRVLRLYVREQKLLTLEQAIHRMTGLSAQHMGFSERGVIRPGAYADLVLLDPATVADRATTQAPGLLSEGIAKVWVNGQLVLERNTPTGSTPGRALRRESSQAWSREKATP